MTMWTAGWAVAEVLILVLAGAARALGQEASWPDMTRPASAVGGGGKDAAVVVGVEDYAFVVDVPGAEANAKAWYDYLTETRGVPAHDVKLLTGVDATRHEMLDAVRSAAADAGSEGTLWFVFVGHGAPSRDGKDGLLVAVDAQQKAGTIERYSVRRGELLRALAETKAGAIRVVLDACFSGRLEDGKAVVPGLQPLVTLTIAGPADPRMVVLTAAKGDQFAGALPGARRPAFSYLALGALRGWAGKSEVAAGDVWRYAVNALEATLRGRDQTPDLMGREDAAMGRSAGEKGPSLAAMAKATAGAGAREGKSAGGERERSVLILEADPSLARPGPGESVSRAMLDAGWEVVAHGLSPREEATAAKRWPRDAGLRAQADVIIVVSASGGQVVSDRLGNLVSYRCALSVKAFDSRTARLLAAASQDSSALDVALEAAAGKATAQAGETVGPVLLAKLEAAPMRTPRPSQAPPPAKQDRGASQREAREIPAGRPLESASLTTEPVVHQEPRPSQDPSGDRAPEPATGRFGPAQRVGEPRASPGTDRQGMASTIQEAVGGRRRSRFVWAALAALVACGLLLSADGRVRRSKTGSSVSRMPTKAQPPGDCALAPVASQDASVGEPSRLLAGKYTLRAKIGEGGMGMVFEAFDNRLKRKVAVKMLRPEIKALDRERANFVVEARTVATLAHPHIVPIFDIVDEGGDLFLVFEFVEGKTLSSLIQEKKRLEIAECKGIFHCVCTAIDAAHRARVLHRDLKPSNIIVRDDGFAKVMDFGLARTAKETISRMTHEDTSGTPVYMAPEQHLGECHRASDIFCLGATFYECVTGLIPFRGPDFLAQKERRSYADPREAVPSLPDGVGRIIQATLDPDPKKRLSDAKAMLGMVNAL
ncbi:MAG: protein kinase [Elusimicrobia bacterium]|nr:protein kinase [Elusimicrobiota bacterium]